MKCNVCFPGMMLCQSCMEEEEDPPTVRIPRKEDSWTPLPIVAAHPYTPAAAFNLPKIRKIVKFLVEDILAPE